ncbi:MAG: prepilin peptidase [Candidatus Pacebacteria bacterium]|nr:prepilin peptidase [Candidatus Paceibacterota bacterium]
MNIFIIIASGILGLIVGSFLNVVIYRFNTGKTLGGRSQCMSCRKVLSWYELVPLFSFLVQCGRCRNCRTKLSAQYFFVELLTGIGFALVALRYSDNIITLGALPALLFGFVLVAVIMVIMVYDMRHLIMPDPFVFLFIGLALLQLFVPIFVGGDSWFVLPSWQALLVGIVIPLPFFILWLISRGRWIGFGDIKFMIGMGFLLGISLGATAVIFSFWLGTICIIIAYIFFAIRHMLSTRSLAGFDFQRIIGKEIPFAPFLILATFAIFIFQFNLFAFLTHF